MTDSELIESVFSVVDSHLRLEMNAEIEAIDMPEAIGRIVIIGDAFIPGLISRIVNKSSPDISTEVISKLIEENPFSDQIIVDWFKQQGPEFPRTSAYLIGLDTIRRMALDFSKHAS